ncbi:MAG: hypothetical protein F6K03_12515 [Kamptonema sp. SIO4C4]|nr:hypothetical protein [Kamptonema sp. SIO4C4]
MSQFSRTWWGEKFIEAMEDLTDSGRLSRGRSYARGNKVKSFTIKSVIPPLIPLYKLILSKKS